MFSRSLGVALCASLTLSLTPTAAFAQATDAAAASTTATSTAAPAASALTDAAAASTTETSTAAPAEALLLEGPYTAEVGADTKEKWTNTIDGNGTLIKTGAGELVLSGDNTYTGETIIAEGQVTASSLNALGESTVIIKDGASLIVDAPLHIHGDLIVEGVAEFAIIEDIDVVVDGNLRVGENENFSMVDKASVVVAGRADIDPFNNHLDWRREGSSTVVRTVFWWENYSPLSSRLVPGNPTYLMLSSIKTASIAGVSLIVTGVLAAIAAAGVHLGLIPTDSVPAPLRQALGR